MHATLLLFGLQDAVVVQGRCSSQEALLNSELASPPAYEP